MHRGTPARRGSYAPHGLHGARANYHGPSGAVQAAAAAEAAAAKAVAAAKAAAAELALMESPPNSPPRKSKAKTKASIPSPNSWKNRKLLRAQKRKDVPAHMMPPRYVVTDPEKTEEYVEYHLSHLPDTSHFPSHDPCRTHFWKMGVAIGARGRKLKGGKARNKPHSVLTGLHCTNTNESLDYCIKNNKWCVSFVYVDDEGNEVSYDLISEFTVRFWLKYSSKMPGRPLGTQKSAQLVLEYLICNPKLLANAWRGKLYRFSSGSLFKQICTPLTEHLSLPGNSQLMLKLDELTDSKFYNILGKCMIKFMQRSKSVFPNALLSKEDFSKDQWKRCMTLVFMGRWVYGKDGQKQWRLFDMTDLKFNMRLFEMWKRMEVKVMSYTKLYKNLPDTCDNPRKRKRIGRGRYRKPTSNNTIVIDETSSASESPMKCVTFDLTGFSDEEDEEVFQVRAPTPPPTQDPESVVETETEDAERSPQSDDDDPAVLFSDDGESGDEDESGSRSP